MKKVSYIVAMILLCVMSIMAVNISSNTYASSVDMFDSFSSTSYVIVDGENLSTLYGMNMNQKMPVASICKLMTTLISLEKIDEGAISVDDMVVASDYACDAEGSQAFLDAGSKYKVGELLKSVIVASANDSAIVLAEAIGGTEQNFVKMMNNRANLLGMHNTVYSNSTGLNAPGQYSTATDTAILLKEIQKHDLYNDYCHIWMDEFVHPTGRVTQLVNTNRLIRYYDNCTGGKTGFTDEAGYCLASSAQNGDLKLIAVVLNAKDSASRFNESVALYNYGFANFENKKVVDSTKSSMTINVKNGKHNKVMVKPEHDFAVVDKRGDNGNVAVDYKLNESISAPFEVGTIVGQIVVSKNGVVVGTVNLVTAQDCEKHSYGDIIQKIVNNWEI